MDSVVNPTMSDATPSARSLVPLGSAPRSAPGLALALASVALVLALLAAALAWLGYSRLTHAQSAWAQRMQALDQQSSQAAAAARQAAAQIADLQAHQGVLEARIAEAQTQQTSLQRLYQDLSGTRDAWALAEVEQIIAVGAQQLQLSGNVADALAALQSADDRLAHSERPQFIALRRALAHDMDRLRAWPAPDLAGNALRLDSLVSMVDRLPLWADEKPAEAPRLDATLIDRSAVSRDPSAVHGGTPSLLERVADGWRYVRAEVWQGLQDLVRVRQVDQPEALLLTPSQAYFVREGLKLRLLNARLALLARQGPIYRADLLRAAEILQTYFDTRAQATLAAEELLKQLQSSATVTDWPTLSESLNALRNSQAGLERH